MYGIVDKIYKRTSSSIEISFSKETLYSPKLREERELSRQQKNTEFKSKNSNRQIKSFGSATESGEELFLYNVQVYIIHITANCNGKLTAITHYEMNVTNALFNLFKIYFKLDRYDVHIELDDAEYVNTDIVDVTSTVLQHLIYYGINDVRLILKTVKGNVRLYD